MLVLRHITASEQQQGGGSALSTSTPMLCYAAVNRGDAAVRCRVMLSGKYGGDDAVVCRGRNAVPPLEGKRAKERRCVMLLCYGEGCCAGERTFLVRLLYLYSIHM